MKLNSDNLTKLSRILQGTFKIFGETEEQERPEVSSVF